MAAVLDPDSHKDLAHLMKRADEIAQSIADPEIARMGIVRAEVVVASFDGEPFVEFIPQGEFDAPPVEPVAEVSAETELSTEQGEENVTT